MLWLMLCTLYACWAGTSDGELTPAAAEDSSSSSSSGRGLSMQHLSLQIAPLHK